jgi:hypothetical protein
VWLVWHGQGIAEGIQGWEARAGGCGFGSGHAFEVGQRLEM